MSGGVASSKVEHGVGMPRSVEACVGFNGLAHGSQRSGVFAARSVGQNTGWVPELIKHCAPAITERLVPGRRPRNAPLKRFAAPIELSAVLAILGDRLLDFLQVRHIADLTRASNAFGRRVQAKPADDMIQRLHGSPLEIFESYEQRWHRLCGPSVEPSGQEAPKIIRLATSAIEKLTDKKVLKR